MCDKIIKLMSNVLRTPDALFGLCSWIERWAEISGNLSNQLFRLITVAFDWLIRTS